MRKALSLIELIFTIVIIALVFTVVPKIVFALNKSDDFSAKQDALFNGMTLMQMITRLHWDENSVTNNLILDTNSTQFKCDATTKYRVGGFIGSRNCENNTTISASAILGKEGETSVYLYNDIDDFHLEAIDANSTHARKYLLHVKTAYLEDSAPNVVLDYATQKAIVDLSQHGTTPTGSTNLKKVDINVTYQGKKTAEHNTSITQFSYVSANIGKIFLSKKVW